MVKPPVILYLLIVLRRYLCGGSGLCLGVEFSYFGYVWVTECPLIGLRYVFEKKKKKKTKQGATSCLRQVLLYYQYLLTYLCISLYNANE